MILVRKQVKNAKTVKISIKAGKGYAETKLRQWKRSENLSRYRSIQIYPGTKGS